MTSHDPYGFREHFRNASIEELVAAFNAGVGSRAWVSARAHYLMALRDAILATGVDCSSVIDVKAGSMSQARRIRLEGNRLVTIPKVKAPSSE